jgi:hypothetical protein
MFIKKKNTMEFYDMDFEEFIQQIEQSFSIKFREEEFMDATNVGQFTEIITRTVNAEMNANCAQQVCFYKLRNFTRTTLKKDTVPDSDLKKVFPSKKRGVFWKDMENKMDFELPEMKYPKLFIYLLNTLLYSILGSFIVMFLSFLTGAFLFLSSLFLLYVCQWVAAKYINYYPCQTISELVNQIVNLNYSKVNKGKFNKKEVEKIIKEMLIEYSGMNREDFNHKIRLAG